MAGNIMGVDIVKDLYKNNPEVLSEILERFAALGPFGEFGWQYLIKRIEPTEPHRTIKEWQAQEKQLLQTLLDRHAEFSRWVEKYTDQGLSLGEALDKAKESMSPSTRQEKRVIELCLKWKALENVLRSLSENKSLEVIAADFHVTDKCVREVYHDFAEFMISDYMGEDCYRNLNHEQQEHLKGLFVDTLNKELTVQEFALQLGAIKRQISREIREYTLQDLWGLTREQAPHAMRLFLESGGLIGEQDLIAWACDKGLKQEDLEAFLSMLAHRG